MENSRNWMRRVSCMCESQLNSLSKMASTSQIRRRSRSKISNCRFTTWNRRPRRTSQMTIQWFRWAKKNLKASQRPTSEISSSPCRRNQASIMFHWPGRISAPSWYRSKTPIPGRSYSSRKVSSWKTRTFLSWRSWFQRDIKCRCCLDMTAIQRRCLKIAWRMIRWQFKSLKMIWSIRSKGKPRRRPWCCNSWKGSRRRIRVRCWSHGIGAIMST